jgi:micrococcal nuclease
VFGGPSRGNAPRGAFGLIVFVLCLVGLFMVYRAGDDSTPDEGVNSGSGRAARPVTVEVDRVVDGDTAKVFYEGQSEYVRYIGIDTPESVKPDSPVECFGEEAADANEALLRGGTARLVFGPEQRDRFGRLLAYVYVRNVMLNARLLRGGFAETLTIPPNDAFSARFDRIESEARNAGRGLWSECP